MKLHVNLARFTSQLNNNKRHFFDRSFDQDIKSMTCHAFIVVYNEHTLIHKGPQIIVLHNPMFTFSIPHIPEQVSDFNCDYRKIISLKIPIQNIKKLNL